MPKRPLWWQLFPAFALLAAATVFGIGYLMLSESQRSLLAQARDQLEELASFLDSQLGPDVPQDRQEFARLCRRLDQASGVRIALLLPDGKVDIDSRNRSEELENQLDREELRQALAGNTSALVRFNSALNQRVLYSAAPVTRHDMRFGVFYFSKPMGPLDAASTRLQIMIALGALAGLALAALASWWAAAGITPALDRLRQAAASVSAGKLGSQVALADARELAELGEAFNRMSLDMQSRIAVLVQNNNEQKAVLASMTEGVLAVDNQEQIISMNKASGQFLGVEPAQVQGRRLREVVRNADLSRFISRALDSQEPIENDVLTHGEPQRVMQARGSALHDLNGRPIGAVVVLNDVTDFRRLEHIRRDFVANVSHELKTPVTSIKGFVETLLDGASQEPESSERFLRIVAKQADRLHAIIEDLLSLSKIEQGEDAESIVLERLPLWGVLENAITSCQALAGEKSIKIVLDCPPSIEAQINPLLLEQAVVNLLDNAIKYSEAGREVRLTGAATDNEITIRVQDSGAGIASEHLARIFERFYRVDPARSRKLGGTGLGLAIVKHIVQAHRGRVSVESTLGAGSTFTIHLPRVA